MIEYRPFTPSDAEPCRRVILACVDDLTGLGPGAREAIRRRVKAAPYAEELGHAFCIVASDDDVLVGVGALRDAEVARMYVDPAYRYRGVGRAIHERLEAEAVRRGLTELELEASLNAVPFYLRLGYRQVRETTWRLDDAEVQNAIMRKTLIHQGCRGHK